MDTMTDRLALPLIAPGQAQKEVAHNEALTLLDLAVHAAVEGAPRNDPPTAPSVGRCWIAGAAPTGAWVGHAHALAGWTGGGWRFVAARPGMTAWDAGTGTLLRWAGAGGWVGGGASAAPAGGTTVDAEARAAIARLTAAMQTHGLITG